MSLTSDNTTETVTPYPLIYRSDWSIVSTRWLLLALASILLILSRYPWALTQATIVWIIAAILVYNLIITILLILGMARNAWFPWLPIIGDIALSVTAFTIPGGADPNLIWIGLYPVLAVAIYHTWWSSVLVAIGLTYTYHHILQSFGLPPFGTTPTTLIFAGFFLVFAGMLTNFMYRSSPQSRAGAYVQNLRRQMRVVYDMASQMSAALDFQKVLDIVLDLSETGLQTITGRSEARQLISMVMMFEAESLRVATCRRLPPADQAITAPAQQGALAEAIQAGHLVFSNEPHTDPELSQFTAIQATRSLIGIPLKMGLETFGVIIFAHPLPDFFETDRVELLQTIAHQAVVALQNARLYQNLLNEKERIVDVEEEARKKLARNLHDGPMQQIAAFAMRANFIRRLIERNPEQAAEELHKVEDLARNTSKEIRQMLFTMRPLILESQGLIPALRTLFEKVEDTRGQKVILQAEYKADEKLSKHVQGVLFYLVDEALVNAYKHAEAEHIWVRLRMRGTNVMLLEIEDDGVGFNVGEVDASYDQRTSLGMVNMRERAELINATIQFNSVIGKGTRIRILVPLNSGTGETYHGD